MSPNTSPPSTPSLVRTATQPGTTRVSISPKTAAGEQTDCTTNGDAKDLFVTLQKRSTWPRSPTPPQLSLADESQTVPSQENSTETGPQPTGVTDTASTEKPPASGAEVSSQFDPIAALKQDGYISFPDFDQQHNSRA